jgi:hypothetical protein
MTDGFATHDWGIHPDFFNHEKVKTVCSTLKDMGINLWFDEERMELDNIRNQMTSAIENTQCLVAFITERYQKKVNSMDSSDACYFEFNFACLKLSNHRIIPVVMEKNMLNQKGWKGRLAAELGNHLYVDMTEAMEKVGSDPFDDSLLKQKCQKIHDRVVKIRNSPFQLPAGASSSAEDGERFIQLTKQLDWIQGFFEQMETKLPGTVILKMNQITDLLSSQSTTNRLLQSLDYEFIIKKIFTMKGSATVNPSSLLASKKKDNNKKNIEIMKAFLLILSEGESELILTILTTLNRLLSKEPQSVSSNNLSFLDFLTSCGILEIIEFLFDNLSLKSRGNKVVEFQLMSSVCLLTRLLAGNEENRNTFLEWDVLSKPAIQEGSSEEVSSMMISGRCVMELCQIIISSETVKVGTDSPAISAHEEWANMDEDGLVTLTDCFLDHIKDPMVTECLLSALFILVKDEANNERLGSLEISHLLIKVLKEYGLGSDCVDDDPKKKHEEMIIKVFEILNIVEESEKNRLLPLSLSRIADLLAVLHRFPIVKHMKPIAFGAVVRKINLGFRDYLNAISTTSSTNSENSTSCQTKEFLRFYLALTNSGFEWRNLCGSDVSFHHGLSLAFNGCRSNQDDLLLILKLMQLTSNDYKLKRDINDQQVDGIHCLYIRCLFELLVDLPSDPQPGLIDFILSRLFSMLSLSTLEYYLDSFGIMKVATLIEAELDQTKDKSSLDSVVPVLEIENRIFQLLLSSPSSLTIDCDCLKPILRSLFKLLNLCSDNSLQNTSDSHMGTLIKAASVLHTTLWVRSSFPRIFGSEKSVGEELGVSLKYLFHLTKELTPMSADSSPFPSVSFWFTLRDLFINVLKSFYLIYSDTENQEYFVKEEFKQAFGIAGSQINQEKNNYSLILTFRSVLFFYQNDIVIMDYVLKIIELLVQEDDNNTLHLFFGESLPASCESCEDVNSNNETDAVVRLLLDFISSNIENPLIIAPGLSLLRHCLCQRVSVSASAKQFKITLFSVMKQYRELETTESKEIIVLCFSIVKSLKELQNATEKDDVDVSFFTALEMKEAGMTLKELKEMGYSIYEIQQVPFTLLQLKDEGFSLKDLKNVGFLLSELKEHYSLEDLLSSGVIASSGVDLKKEGYSIEEVKLVRKPAAEMKEYYSLTEIRDGYGLTDNELRDLGYDLGEVNVPMEVVELKGFESSVILTVILGSALLSLLPSNVSSVSLLYRGSRDGFIKSSYSLKCDNQGPHVVIVKCGEGYIFGGYMSLPNLANGLGTKDPSNTCFLFTLKNPKGEIAKKYPIKPDQNDKAFYAKSILYPFYFGTGPDMYTGDLKDVRFTSVVTYEDYGETNLRFTGKNVSNISEVEVWKILL